MEKCTGAFKIFVGFRNFIFYFLFLLAVGIPLVDIYNFHRGIVFFFTVRIIITF